MTRKYSPAQLQSMIDTIRLYKASAIVSPVSKEYRMPSVDLLSTYEVTPSESLVDSDTLERKIADFGLENAVENVRKGPMISRYEVRLARGVRLSAVRNRSEDLALALMADRVRIQAPIPGTGLVGIEMANKKFSLVGLKPLIEAVKNFRGELPIGIGVDIVGVPKVIDLARMPHLLIAGQTGSGKSVGLNAIILSILYTKTPEECKLMLVDPKRVEMTSYKDLPHLYCPVINEPSDAVKAFEDLVLEMEHRYEVLSINKVRNIMAYNEIATVKMPYIVTVIDEMADLMMTAPKEMERCIVRLAQLSRAVGIHLVLATQRPTSEVITGLIKSNMPSRIAYQVVSNLDSRVILDCSGAEKLLGRGDLLMLYPGIGEPERYHGAWVSDAEIAAVTESLK